MTRIPAHAAANIETRTGAPIGATRVQPGTCRRCGAPILAALDHPTRMAGLAVVDPTPLDPATELACVLAGRGTWQLVDKELRRRDQWTLTTPPSPACRVVPAHVCEAPLPSAPWPLTDPPTTSRSADAEPPY